MKLPLGNLPKREEEVPKSFKPPGIGALDMGAVAKANEQEPSKVPSIKGFNFAPPQSD